MDNSTPTRMKFIGKAKEKTLATVHFIKSRTKKINSKVKSTIQITKEFLATTTEKDLKEWKLKDDKTLLEKGREVILNGIVTYGLAGLAITFALHTIVETPMTISWIASVGIAYWLLKKLLLMARTGKENN